MRSRTRSGADAFALAWKKACGRVLLARASGHAAARPVRPGRRRLWLRGRWSAAGRTLRRSQAAPAAERGAPEYRGQPPRSAERIGGVGVLAEASGWLWVTHFESSLLSQVDPRTGAEAAVVEVGANAGSVTAIADQLWIGQYHQPARARPADVGGSTDGDGRGPRAAAAPVLRGGGRRRPGVGGGPRGTLLAIDPSARVVSATTVPVNPAVHIGLVGDERALWLSSDTTALLRIDPTDARVVASLDVGGGIPMTMAPDSCGARAPTTYGPSIRPRTTCACASSSRAIETLSLATVPPRTRCGWARAGPGYVEVVLRVDLASGRASRARPSSASRPDVAAARSRASGSRTGTPNRLLRFD